MNSKRWLIKSRVCTTVYQHGKCFIFLKVAAHLDNFTPYTRIAIYIDCGFFVTQPNQLFLSKSKSFKVHVRKEGFSALKI